MKVVYKYFAIKPLSAEHPVGSGLIVKYEPGDEIPAGEWGRAAGNLVEVGKAARVAFNVPEEGDPQEDSATVSFSSSDMSQHPSAVKKPVGRPRKNP